MCYREIKRLRRQKRKLREHAAKKGDEYRETSELTRQEDLFHLGHIKSRDQLEEVERGEMETPEDGEEEEESDSESEDEGMEGVISCLETRHYHMQHRSFPLMVLLGGTVVWARFVTTSNLLAPSSLV